eukprot:gene11743-12964_t
MLLKRWLIAMRWENWTPTSYQRICEKHFLPSDYSYPPSLPNSKSLGKKYLKKDAIPSVFNFPAHLKKKSPKKRSTTKRCSPPIVTTSSKSTSPDPKKIKLDHSYASALVSPRKIRDKYKKKLAHKNKVINKLRVGNIRKAKSIQNLMQKLKSLKLLSEENAMSINDNFGHMATELFRNEAKNVGKHSGSRYSTDVKEFAISLHYYSPRAYMYVRKYLNLPHPATIRSWSVNVQCEPGFLSKTLDFVETKVKDGEQDCVIMLDEMSIKSQLLWDKKNAKFAGNVDYGALKAEPNDSIAKNALVIMVSGLQTPWYVPIAYFLTNSINGDIQKQLIYEAISLLTEKGAKIHAVIFDGASKNITMAAKLGCDVSKLEFKFPHPTKHNEKIHVILDICHMLKLARNAFADIGVFYTASGERIAWDYIAKLYDVQKTDILNIANKLTSKHIQWQNHKMKVSVAAQTLSNSVAAAITFLRRLKVAEFKDSEETSHFIQLINNLFDILNSKSKFGKHSKSPITSDNIDEIESYIKSSIEYLKHLKDPAGVQIIKGQRKTFVKGFAISAFSVLSICKILLERSEVPFQYILTYRFSQDRIEMFFSKIRSRFGWNNNPNVLQFKYALRQLLLKNKIESPSTANCVDVTDVNSVVEPNSVDASISEMLLSTNEWRPDVLFYIAGYIVKKIKESSDCPECVVALYEDCNMANEHAYTCSSLISCKRYGKLFIPSNSVFKIVQHVDKVARTHLGNWQYISKEVNTKIMMLVLQETRTNTFQSLQEHSVQSHVIDNELRDDHITVLIKLIVKHYLILFYYQFGKVYTERVIKQSKASRRNKLTKQILFYNE